MGYAIQYGERMTKEYIPDNNPQAGKKGPLIWISIGLLLGGLLLTDPGKDLCRSLLPGNPDVTGAALEEFAENLSEGRSLLESATVFCREVIDGAEIPA